MKESQEKLISYLLDQNRLSEADAGRDAALFSSGLLDSFAMMDLVAFVEETFSIRVSAKEITLRISIPSHKLQRIWNERVAD